MSLIIGTLIFILENLRHRIDFSLDERNEIDIRLEKLTSYKKRVNKLSQLKEQK